MGPNGGAGKSSTMAHVLREKKGVVAMMISSADTRASIITRLSNKCGIAVKQSFHIDFRGFFPLLRKATEERNGLRITFVFEMMSEGSSSVETLWLLKNVAKQLGRTANVIIVLSEATDGLYFTDDPRQNIIWVDEMSAKEAEDYAKQLNPGVSDADLQLLFDKVGTLPLDVLFSMRDLKEGMSAAQIVQQAVERALRELCAFDHQPILTALKASPDGVYIGVFDGVYHEGVYLGQPKDVAVAMIKSNAIVYHIPSREYRLASRAHRAALTQHNPSR